VQDCTPNANFVVLPIRHPQVQKRLDEHPEKMRQRRETVEHPFGTIKARMGATHFLMKTLPRVASEMALHVLAYNLTRVMNIVGIQPLLAAIRA
jgi:DDE family transposase